jgi:hypothetical protein
VYLREAAGFPSCPFCGVGLALDRTGVRPHYLYRPRLTAPELLPLLRRWADRHDTESPAGPVSARLIFYPFWRYVREGPLRLVPAWPTTRPTPDELRPPDAEQVFFDASHLRDADAIDPALPEEAARVRAFGRTSVPPGDLVHVPFYEVHVRFGGVQRRVSVEACSGTVLRPDGESPPRRRPSLARHPWPLVACGLLMVVAAATIRHPAMAAAVVAVVAAILSVGLRGHARLRGGRNASRPS